MRNYRTVLVGGFVIIIMAMIAFAFLDKVAEIYTLRYAEIIIPLTGR